MRSTLANAAQRAGCSGRVVPHRLRHSFATEMLRLGVSLPALMQLLGHKDIRMTLRYKKTCGANFTTPASGRLNPLPSPNSHSLATLPMPIFWESARRWRLRVISWRCIAASSVTPKPSASCGA